MQDLALSSSDSQNILSNPKNKDDSADSIAFLACEAYLISFSILSCSYSICRDMFRIVEFRSVFLFFSLSTSSLRL